MMFIAPRFIAIDDKQEHLTAIRNAFHAEGSDCHCVIYEPAADLEAGRFRGVRVLFTDLHLTQGPAGSTDNHHYGVIATILEQVISATGGPFVLVLWTEHPQKRDDLAVYLDANLDPAKPYAKPIAILTINKSDFINLTTGEPMPDQSLQTALRTAVTENPQIAALLQWEAEVVAAAGNTLASVLALVPAEDRNIAGYPHALNQVMSRLAGAALGKGNAAANPRAAMNAALAPILSDRILNQNPLPESNQLWQQAVTLANAQGLGAATPVQASAINGMMHVARPSAEDILPSDWGSVVDFPFAWTDAETQRLFGVAAGDLQTKEFRIKPEKWQACSVKLVRIGANCDYAQNKPGPLTFLLGVEMPTDAISNNNRSRSVTPASEWRSPLLPVGPDGVARELAVNCRYFVSVPANACAAWVARYRLREALLTDLINHNADHISRPGYIRMDP